MEIPPQPITDFPDFLVIMKINFLVFYCPPQTLHKNIII